MFLLWVSRATKVDFYDNILENVTVKIFVSALIIFTYQ
jgi:hypothetical protein